MNKIPKPKPGPRYSRSDLAALARQEYSRGRHSPLGVADWRVSAAGVREKAERGTSVPSCHEEERIERVGDESFEGRAGDPPGGWGQ